MAGDIAQIKQLCPVSANMDDDFLREFAVRKGKKGPQKKRHARPPVGGDPGKVSVIRQGLGAPQIINRPPQVLQSRQHLLWIDRLAILALQYADIG